MDQSIISLAYKYNGWGIALYILIVTLVSGVLSAIIGVEREIKGQAAGLRTHVLLSIGCTLIMTISIFGIGFASGQIDFSQGYIDASNLSYDTSRIGAGITAGIGFVCAGTIIRTGLSVRGLTTAATLWVSAGIGMACGSGLVLEAIIVAAVTMILLTGLLHIEKAIGKRSPQIKLTVAKNTVVIKAIRMERKLELAMEGQRWFDLARWGGDYMAAELKAYVDYEKQYIPKFAGATYLPASKTMFPVPDQQILDMGNDENGQPYLVQPGPWK